MPRKPLPPAVDAEEPKGIPCRRCGCCQHYTIETRKIPNGRLRRRRQCRYCGLRFTTYERAF